jgi:hypothetical protein
MLYIQCQPSTYREDFISLKVTHETENPLKSLEKGKKAKRKTKALLPKERPNELAYHSNSILYLTLFWEKKISHLVYLFSMRRK